MALIFDQEKYTHEADRAALKALKAIPGFTTLLKAFMNVWNERQQRILNMSSRIRLGENQMKKYHDMLPPICEKLGIPVPELYLEMNVAPNAYTSGDTNPFIVITSGLLKTLPEELIPTVLAHECGHIACHHVLYLTMGRIVLQGAGSVLSSAIPLGSLLTVPLQIAFYYWMRCSEFSADRVAVLCDGTDRRMEEVCMRMAGWDKEIDAEVSIDAFLNQAGSYRDMINESKWNKALEFMILSQASHPLMAVRATECRAWFNSAEYQDAARNLASTDYRLEAPGTKAGNLPAGSSAGDATGTQGQQAQSGGLLSMPEGYKTLARQSSDPKDALIYGRVSTQGNTFIQVFPIAREGAMCFETPEAIIRAIHNRLTDNEGLVQVGSGTTPTGRMYAYSIIKTLQRPRSTEYQLTLHVEDTEAVIAVAGYFLEMGSPGFREASVKGQLKRELQGADVEATWRQDPYDPEYRKGLLMNEAEKEKYDARFPLHPLTEARAFTAGVISLN